MAKNQSPLTAKAKSLSDAQQERIALLKATFAPIVLAAYSGAEMDSTPIERITRMIALTIVVGEAANRLGAQIGISQVLRLARIFVYCRETPGIFTILPNGQLGEFRSYSAFAPRAD